MKIVGIDHVQLAMPAGAEDEARRFYALILGVPERPKPEELAARGGVWFESAEVKIQLGVDSDFRPAKKAHPGLLVDALAELVIRLRRAGHEVRGDRDADRTRAYVADPFGNRLEPIEGDSPRRDARP